MRLLIALFVSFVLASCVDSTPAEPGGPRPSAYWTDDFDGPAGSLPDSTRWRYDLGNNGGWGNGELQRYTADRANVHLDGAGHLVIRVEATADGYTSARLKTEGLRAAQFGHVEARIKLPAGRGMWPAFWMLGGTFNGSNWPGCGEIDLLEMKGQEPSVLYGGVHGPGYSGGDGITKTLRLADGASFADDFHVFAVDWQPGSIQFLVDGSVFQTVTPQAIPLGSQWVSDQPFFILLNVAVGGHFVGSPDENTRFPQEMLVDYVRYTP
jgi:beta-glucanase (GH16 family)